MVSAMCPYHFTETILIKVVSELYTGWSRPISDFILPNSWIKYLLPLFLDIYISLGFLEILFPVLIFTSLTASS